MKIVNNWFNVEPDAYYLQSMVGTLYYVAPEVIGPSTNKRNVGYGHSVDAYSVGCITYFL